MKRQVTLNAQVYYVYHRCFYFISESSYDGSRTKVFMLVKTSLTQRTKPIDNVDVIQNIDSRK